jgi:hypothetical protein
LVIHIIGTSHSLQIWTEVIRTGESPDASTEMVEKFETYLVNVAKAVKAKLIAEELDEQLVSNYGPQASSVAKDVAKRLGVGHLFCDPNTVERRAMGLKVGTEMVDRARAIAKETGEHWVDVHWTEVKKGFAAREAVWLERLLPHRPNSMSIVFVCGADHVDSFKAMLEAGKIHASIHCRDWTEQE